MGGARARTFWDTPQHMPEELLATMPPTMQESMEEGSGPILYWIGCPPLALCRASSALISPPIRPGSTVMLLPSPCTPTGRRRGSQQPSRAGTAGTSPSNDSWRNIPEQRTRSSMAQP